MNKKQWLNINLDSAEAKFWSESEDGLLYCKQAVYILDDGVTKEEILRINYNNLGAGHFDKKRILELIRRKYY